MSSAPYSGAAPQSGAPPSVGLCVVGIGASAGGVAALRTLFREVPENSGAAFVVVVHLSPEHESLLDEVLEQHTALPVEQVTGTVALEPNHVYVIPPNANLDAVDTHLRLSPLPRRRSERAPIDHFFRTLARFHGGRSVAVVLTGNGSDGSLGLRRIRESGGLAIAQDPDEAECPDMPRSAIASGSVDVVAPLRGIVAKALAFCATQPALPPPDGNADPAVDAALRELLAALRAATGRELADYNRANLYRRIRRRMQIHQTERLEEYLEVLRNRPDEPRALADDLLLTAADFFGDGTLFDALARDVLPSLFARKAAAGEVVRAWSIGCATGEEAYSLGMLLLEQGAISAPGLDKPRVFATDPSEELLQRARAGVYPYEIAEVLSPERLERFFEDLRGQYAVRRELRDLVVFTSHDLYLDPPFLHLDLIVCRSLLRGLQPTARKSLLKLLHYALNENGHLVLGPHDEIEEAGLFRRVGERGIYARVGHAAAPGRERLAHFQDSGRTAPPPRSPQDDLARLHERLVQRFAAPSIVVDPRGDVVHFSDGVSPFVRMPSGEPTRQAAALVRKPLRSALENALEFVRANGGSTRSAPVTLQSEEGVHRVALRAGYTAEGWVLVSFETAEAETVRTAAVGGDETSLADGAEDLARARRRLDAALRARSADRRSFQSSQLGMQIEIDELQTILEDLESSRQDLQAANQELTALDADNRRKIDELAELSQDLRHLLDSTGVATVFVDRDLKILRFTPQLAVHFGLRNDDRGRPLADLSLGLPHAALEQQVREVIDTGRPLDREMPGTGEEFYVVRTHPYLVAGRVHGAVVTLIDITERRRVEERLREGDRRKDEFLALLAHELRNPLAPIMSGVEVLKMAGNDPRIVERVSTTLARQTRQLVRLVDDLLELSRISGGRLKLQRAPVALADVVRDAAAAAQPAIELSGHKLTVTLSPEPLLLDADAQRLTQVFGNLLNNAARYTPRGGKISLVAHREGDEAVVVVSDSGIGMSQRTREHVFEMFFQGADRAQSREAGLGIGLTLAKSLVEMHGGSIAAASEGPGRGSEFTLRLPLAARGSAALGKPPDEPAELAGRRVLIVDDNTDAAETLAALLRTLGANDVRTAATGAEALAAGRALEPDIVLLDLKMPGMDGFEVARRVRELPWGARTLLVALTGYGQDDYKRRTQEAGFDRHLTKPADRATIATLLAHARGTDRAH